MGVNLVIKMNMLLTLLFVDWRRAGDIYILVNIEELNFGLQQRAAPPPEMRHCRSHNIAHSSCGAPARLADAAAATTTCC